MKPNLLLVGFQKCGSSYLFDLLTQHPQIIGTIPKETFFLTDEGYENYNFLKNASNKDAPWTSFFPKNKQNVSYYLEASVCNFYQQKALEYAKYNSETKILFILRNPIDRFISNYKYYSGNIPKLKKNISIEEYYDKVSRGEYSKDSLKYAIEHGKYHKYIKKWEEAIGRDKLLIISFKNIITKPNIELKKIYDFLDLEYPTSMKLKMNKVNVSREVRFRSLHIALQAIFGKKFPFKKNIKKIYYQLFTSKKELIVSEKLKAKLNEEYKEELEQYRNLL